MKLVLVCCHPGSYFSLFLVQFSDRVDQSVGSQDYAGALRPLCTHQAMLTQQDLPNVFCPCDPDDRFSQKVGLKHVSMTFSTRDVEVGTLRWHKGCLE